jgi:hypothetical protein
LATSADSSTLSKAGTEDRVQIDTSSIPIDNRTSRAAAKHSVTGHHTVKSHPHAIDSVTANANEMATSIRAAGKSDKHSADHRESVQRARRQ